MRLSDRQIFEVTTSLLWPADEEEEADLDQLRAVWTRAGRGPRPSPAFLRGVADDIVSEIREDVKERGKAALEINGDLLMDAIRNRVPLAVSPELDLVYVHVQRAVARLRAAL